MARFEVLEMEAWLWLGELMGNSWCKLLSLSGLTEKRKITEVGFTSWRFSSHSASFQLGRPPFELCRFSLASSSSSASFSSPRVGARGQGPGFLFFLFLDCKVFFGGDLFFTRILYVIPTIYYLVLDSELYFWRSTGRASTP